MRRGNVANGVSVKVPRGFFIEVPDWVSHVLKRPKEKIASLEVTANSENNYSILLDYCAHRAVDVSEPLPVPPEDDVISLKKKTNINQREYEGRLSTLYLPKPDDNTSFYTDSEDEIDDVPDTEDACGDDTGSQPSSNSRPWDVPPTTTFLLGFGCARIEHQGTSICITHLVNDAPGHAKSAKPYPSLRLFADTPERLRSLAETAIAWDYERKRPEFKPRLGKYVLYTLKVSDDDVLWNHQGLKPGRSLESIILPPGLLDDIVAEFRDFSAKGTKAWYLRHGLPYRRSFLFYGPPGTGKTSTIRALAGTLELNACFLTLGDHEVGNRELQIALRNIPRPAMLVIEDVDALFNEARKSENPSPLTFSGLLNALDGLVSADGILTVMTTNHIDRLDAALIRAGRVDRKFKFKLPSQQQMIALFKSFYPDANDALAREFADQVFARPEKEARSIATLQEHFIFTRKKTARESVDELDAFFKAFYLEGGYDSRQGLYV